MAERFDFSGWATRNNMRCSDGRTIRKNAFKNNDGEVVPLIWQHDHTSPAGVIGHALLENRNEGVYAYCSLNDNEAALAAKEAIKHGDIDALSIYANHLQQNGGDVIHGEIREVSLVIHGANPGAFIDNVMMHGDMEVYEESGFIYNDELIDDETTWYLNHNDDGSVYLSHEDEEDEEGEEVSEEKEEKTSGKEKTVKDVYDAMTKEEKSVVAFMIGVALDNERKKNKSGETETKSDKNETKSDETAKHSDIEEENDMKHNAFDTYSNNKEAKFNSKDPAVLQHGEEFVNDLPNILEEAKTGKVSSLKDTILKHADDYGIQNIDWLFPDVKNLDNVPGFVKRDDSWVSEFMNGVRRTPFSRIRTIFADIREDEARAKGYITAHRKVEEVFKLLKRETTPVTIYKKQKLDRNDVVDITSFDVVAWIRSEMRTMLNEEIARACLFSDGRPVNDDDKINEANVRPIYNDDDLFTVKVPVAVAADDDDDVKARKMIRAIIKARKNYRGSGNPNFYTTEDALTDLLLLEDGMGRRLYRDMSELATALRVRNIITVEAMAGLTRTFTDATTHETITRDVIGIIVNPADYTIGTDRGGEINNFDDFDIDLNQYKYLMETRIAGCLTKPYAAMTIEWDVQE